MTDWALEGREQGLVEGREQGKTVGASDITLRLLKRKFGSLEPEIEQQIQDLPLARLQELSEDLLDFTQVSQLEAWLKQAQV